MNFAEFHDQITSHIEASGLFIVGVMGGRTEPSFSYTIGLSNRFGFELLVVGLPFESAKTILNEIAATGSAPELNVPVTRFTNLPLMFRRCEKDLDDLHSSYVCQADRYFDCDVNVVQVVLSDRQGRLPGEPGFDAAHMNRVQRLFFAVHQH